jgi:hypothetical protein
LSMTSEGTLTTALFRIVFRYLDATYVQWNRTALARETRTIPTVFTAASDPIGEGFAASFAHPGGNITGFTGNDPAIRNRPDTR